MQRSNNVTSANAPLVSIEQHQRILGAYIGRLALDDLKSLVTAMEGCWAEQLNGNAGSQRSADKVLEEAVLNAVSKMLSHDREIVARILQREISSKACS